MNLAITYEQDPDVIEQLPVVKHPPVDDSHPLTDYFISYEAKPHSASMSDVEPRTSHNTYLLSRQLVGRASAAPYTHVLSDRNCRCVEIDVWPSKNGPIVTHGYTLSESVSLSHRLIPDSIQLSLL